MALEPVERHPYAADVSFDGGDLDCGNGLLLLIRQHLDPLVPGQLLEFRSVEISAEEDFPAWCRLNSPAGRDGERVLLTPDCGFATFADTPMASAAVAEAKLRALGQAAELVRRG